MLGLGRADDRAHPAEAALAEQARREAVDHLGQALVQRRAAGAGRSWTSAAPGFEVRTRAKTPRRRFGRGGDQRLERVAAEQGVGGEGVGAEAGHGAPGCRRLADQGLRVGGGGDRHVAALAVGDTRSPASRAAATASASAVQPGAPSRSKQAS